MKSYGMITKLLVVVLMLIVTTVFAQSIWAQSKGEPAISGSTFHPVEVPPTSIDGKKFDDVNGNGVQDYGEPGLPGWRIDLLDANYAIQQTCYTNQNGYYQFGTQEGCYTIMEEARPGWTQTYPPTVFYLLSTYQELHGCDFGNDSFCDGGVTGIYTWLHGTNDNFVGPEPSYMSDDLADWLVVNAPPCAVLYNFDQVANDAYFGHTFMFPKPREVWGATLRIKLKATGNVPDNDWFALGHYSYDDNPCSYGRIWSISMNDLLDQYVAPGSPDWSFGMTMDVTLDLANLWTPTGSWLPKNILAALQGGLIDIIIADDTEVDFIELTIEDCENYVDCTSNRGNANGDPDDIVDVSDVVYLINYLFKGGTVPLSMEEANANGDSDEVVDVADVIYLINYLFKGGPIPPPCPEKSGRGDLSSASHLSITPGHAKISLVLDQADQTTASVPALSKPSPEAKDKVFQIAVLGKSDRDVAGVQLEIGFDPGKVTMLDPTLTPLTEDLQLYTSIKDGVQKIGILDLTGENLIPAGEGALVILRAKGEDLSSIKINKAVLVDKDAMPLALKLSGELKQEEAKSEMVKVSESKPTSFSLSQNYPNPFNPETDISYALPSDCQVRLTIYNVAGQNVRTLVDEHQTTGFKTIHWNGKDSAGKEVASGVYFYKIQAGTFTDSRKMILMK